MVTTTLVPLRLPRRRCAVSDKLKSSVLTLSTAIIRSPSRIPARKAGVPSNGWSATVGQPLRLTMRMPTP